jgi:ribosomal protein L11 methyltransferase
VSWWQLSVQCNASELDSTEDILLSLGAIAITLNDAYDEPLYEPLPGETPVWQESIVTGLFENGCTLESLHTGLALNLPSHIHQTLQTSTLQDQDWIAAYKKHFKPIQCDDNLWIVPSWSKAPDPTALNITLDPGVAFGTGGHPTTALCLSWLSQNPPTGMSGIDFGCGSGILAIAALKLGAKNVVGIDIDPQALTASRLNANTNDIDDKQLPLFNVDHEVHDPVDFVIANILSGPLIELSEKLISMLKPGGKLVLSGILQIQIDETRKAYEASIIFDEPSEKDDWARLTGVRIGG